MDLEINSLQEEIRLTKKEVDKSKDRWDEKAIYLEKEANEEVQ